MYNGPQNRFRSYSRLSQPINIKLGDNTVIQATHKGLIKYKNTGSRLYTFLLSATRYSRTHVALTTDAKKKLSIAESRIWYKRLGHLAEAAIKAIINGYVDDGNTCKVSIQAKLRRKIIRVPVQRTTTPFELVHSDLGGPSAIRSAGGAQ
jgi:hypothetical protein